MPGEVQEDLTSEEVWPEEENGQMPEESLEEPKEEETPQEDENLETPGEDTEPQEDL